MILQRLSWCMQSRTFESRYKWQIWLLAIPILVLLFFEEWISAQLCLVLFWILLFNLPTYCLILFTVTFPHTLMAANVRLINLQFQHSKRLPVFGILTMSPPFHNFGPFSYSKIDLNKLRNELSVVIISVFNNSAVMPSLPSTFQFLT